MDAKEVEAEVKRCADLGVPWITIARVYGITTAEVRRIVKEVE